MNAPADTTQPSAEKRLATLRAKCALAGVQLLAAEDDRGAPTFICTKWACTASMSTLDEVEQWLERFAGVKA